MLETGGPRLLQTQTSVLPSLEFLDRRERRPNFDLIHRDCLHRTVGVRQAFHPSHSPSFVAGVLHAARTRVRYALAG